MDVGKAEDYYNWYKIGISVRLTAYFPLLDLTIGMSQTTIKQHSQQIGKILDNSIQLTGIVGSGAYGVVYTAIDLNLNKKLAVKCLSKNRNINNKSNANDNIKELSLKCIQNKIKSLNLSTSHVDLLYKEIGLHSIVDNHSNIVTVQKVFESNDCIYMVMDFFAQGDLFHNITDLKCFVGKDKQVLKVFLQLVDATLFCHNHGIYHCDIKPENILVCDDGQTVKLADFGLATLNPISRDFGCGSSFYMSPERLLNLNTNSNINANVYGFSSAQSDLWALGVVLLNLLCGRNPWKSASLNDGSSFKIFLNDDRFLEKIMPISHELNNILNRVFHINPSNRLTLEEFRDLIVNCPSLSRPSRPTIYQPQPSPFAPPQYLATPIPSPNLSIIPPSPPVQSTSYLEPFYIPQQYHQQQQLSTQAKYNNYGLLPPFVFNKSKQSSKRSYASLDELVNNGLPSPPLSDVKWLAPPPTTTPLQTPQLQALPSTSLTKRPNPPSKRVKMN